MTRPAIAYLSGKNLRHNISVIQKKANHSQVIAMIKANAYGHGMVETAKHIDDLNCYMGVASIDDGIDLRNAGIKSNILLIQGPFQTEDIPLAIQYDCDMVFHQKEHISWLDEVSTPNKLKVWIKVNTGMNRLGFSMEEVESVYNTLQDHPKIKEGISIVSHFSCASKPDGLMNAHQLQCIKDLKRKINTKFSLANTGGIFYFPESHYDYVRPGIAMYGVSSLPGVMAEDLNLKPVMTLKSIVNAVRHVKKGEYIGYSATYQAKEDMIMAVIAFGHADGYPVTAPVGTPILVNGVRCPIIGPVSMDMIILDVTKIKDVKIGDEAVIWGDGLPLDEIIQHTKVSPGSMLALLRSRVKYIWVD